MGVHEPKELQVSPSFLRKGVNTLSSMKDGGERHANASLETTVVKPNAMLTIRLNPEGRYVSRVSGKCCAIRRKGSFGYGGTGMVPAPIPAGQAFT